jgi:hypothetical protein
MSGLFSGLPATVQRVNGILLRPFRQRVNLLDAALLLALLLAIAGMWHLVLERLELPVPTPEV